MGTSLHFRIFALTAIFLTPGIASAEAVDHIDHSGTSSGISSVAVLLIVYCVLVALSSMFGGILPMMIRLTHTRMQLLVSLIGGLMLGVGIFHQLPHAVAAMPAGGSHGISSLDWCMAWLMFGLLLTFFMLRMFHFHSHQPMEEDGDHSHDCDHDHDHGEHHQPTKKTSWIGIFLGLSLHTLLDGVALAANVQADSLHYNNGVLALFGFGTFLGVVLHKPLDSLSITSLMATGGWSKGWMRFVNVGYALMCPIGAGLFYLGIQRYAGIQDVIVAASLAMSAGVFLCIALSDLLPEVQFHSHDRFALSLALLAGVGLAWGIGFLEPEHTHNHAHAPAAHQELSPDDAEHGHHHGDHDHAHHH